jgi:Tfp pilus assembly protein PilF
MPKVDFKLTVLLRQAHAAVNQRSYLEAVELCQQVLQQKANEPNALALLGRIHTNTAQHEEAVDFFKRAVKAAPKDPNIVTQAGQAFAASGDYDQALIQFERALKLKPDSDAARAGKAAVLERLNKYDRAERTLAPVLKRGTPPPSIASIYLRILIHEEAYERAIEVGEAIAAAGHKPSMPLRVVLFELARAYERSGDVEKAFDAASRGNAMLAAPFDREAHRQKFTDLIRIFTRDRIRSLPRPSEPSDVPIFIVGALRTGSTLVERIVHAHPDAFGAGEISYLSSVVQSLPSNIRTTQPYPQCIADLRPEDIDTQSRAYLDRLLRLAPRAKRIADKNLGNHRHGGLINILFPSAPIVHMRRDPVDTCLSCYMEPIVPSTAFCTTDLRALGACYREYQRLMDHWRDVLDVEMLEVDYETLVADQERETRRVIDFCGLPWDDACLSFHAARRAERTLSFDQVRKPMYRSSIGRAERFGALLDPLREALSGD